MTKTESGILFAMCLADGYISVDSRGYCQLHLRHAARQREYAEYKANLLHSIIGGTKPKIHEIDNNGYPGVTFTKCHKHFRFIRKALYRDRSKVVTESFLKRIGAHGLAIWWMDDGSLYVKKRHGIPHSREGILSTYCSIEEAMLISKWLLGTFGITSHIWKNKGRFNLRFNVSDLNRLIPVIAPYVNQVPGMAYKIDMRYTNGHERRAQLFEGCDEIVPASEETRSGQIKS